MRRAAQTLYGLLRSEGVALFVAAFALALCGPAHSDATDPSSPILAVFGDMPYGASVDYYVKADGGKHTDEMVLEHFILPTLKSRRDIPFVVHIGDIGRPDGGSCTDASLDKVVGFSEKIDKPMFYTPGDNDWADCNRDDVPIPQRKDPITRLSSIREKAFGGFDGWYWRAAPTVKHWDQIPRLELRDFKDEPQFGKYPENLMWTYQTDDGRRVLLATVHIVGSNDGRAPAGAKDQQARQREVDERESNNQKWFDEIFAYAKTQKLNAVIVAMHVDPFLSPQGFGCQGVYGWVCLALENLATRFSKESIPVLMMHGDTNGHCLDKPLAGVPNLWRLNAPGDYKVIDADVVRLSADSNRPFTATGLLSGLPAPDACDDSQAPDEKLAKIRLGALVWREHSRCDQEDISADTNPAKIAGFLRVEPLEAGRYYVNVRFNQATPSKDFRFSLKCQGTLGRVVTDERGVAEGGFEFVPKDAHTSFGFDMYPDGEVQNSLQSESIQFPK